MTTPALGIDFGTTHTVAVLIRDDGRAEPLLFESSPLLPSAVYAQPDGRLLVGRDAERAARADPARFEPHPKRRIDEGRVLLGDTDHAVTDLLAAALGRVHEEARRVLGAVPDRVVVTHPAGWAARRRELLAEAVRTAGFAAARFVAEPVAAAAYFAVVLRHQVPDGHAVVVYDFGGGTFDISVVRRRGDDWEVVAAAGLDDVGGVDLDAAVVEWAGEASAARGTEAWTRLSAPAGAADRRHRRHLWEDARAAKEQLARANTADLAVPIVDADVHLTREEFERLARPWLERTVALTTSTLFTSAVTADRLAGVFLVGGSSRIPLVATLLHRALGVAPVAIEQPELVVAQGSVHASAAQHTGAHPAPSPVATPALLPPPIETPAVPPPPPAETPAETAPPPARPSAPPTAPGQPLRPAQTAQPETPQQPQPVFTPGRLLLGIAAAVVAVLLVPRLLGPSDGGMALRAGTLFGYSPFTMLIMIGGVLLAAGRGAGQSAADLVKSALTAATAATVTLVLTGRTVGDQGFPSEATSDDYLINYFPAMMRSAHLIGWLGLAGTVPLAALGVLELVRPGRIDPLGGRSRPVRYAAAAVAGVLVALAGLSRGPLVQHDFSAKYRYDSSPIAWMASSRDEPVLWLAMLTGLALVLAVAYLAAGLARWGRQPRLRAAAGVLLLVAGGLGSLRALQEWTGRDLGVGFYVNTVSRDLWVPVFGGKIVPILVTATLVLALAALTWATVTRRRAAAGTTTPAQPTVR
jgi:Ethanolamine utilization protein EutJ (predicted chaperonin)